MKRKLLTLLTVLMMVIIATSAANAEILELFFEDFEDPNVSGYAQGTTPDAWVRGWGSGHGLIDKDSGLFTAPEGNDQGYMIRQGWTNGITTAEGVIGAIERYTTYTLSFDIVPSVGGDTKYSVRLVAYGEGAPRDDSRFPLQPSTELFRARNQSVAYPERTTITTQYTTGKDFKGLDIGVLFTGEGLDSVIDNVQVVAEYPPVSLGDDIESVVGDSFQLTPTFEDGYTPSTLYWTSSDPNVAAFDSNSVPNPVVSILDDENTLYPTVVELTIHVDDGTGEKIQTVFVDVYPAGPKVTSFEDTRTGGNIIGNTINYIVTFDADMDPATITTADFENAGTAEVTIDSVTQVSPSVYSIAVTPTTAGTVQLSLIGTGMSSTTGDLVEVPVTDTAEIVIVDETELFFEDFESPVVSGYAPGQTPAGWVSYRRNTTDHGLINKDTGLFTALEGNDQGYTIPGFWQSNITTAEGVIGVLERYSTYTVSFDIIPRIDGTSAKYLAIFAAIPDGAPHDLTAGNFPEGTTILKEGGGQLVMPLERTNITMQYTSGKDIERMDLALRFRSKDSDAVIDNVSIIADLPPVSIGPDLATCSGESFQLTSTFEDGYTPSTVLWTISDPNYVTIDSNSVTDPVVTILNKTTDNPTVVEMTIHVDDGSGEEIQTVLIEVYDDACTAARLGRGLNPGVDYDNNCVIDPLDLAAMAAGWLVDTDLEDFAVLAENWLKDYSTPATGPVK